MLELKAKQAAEVSWAPKSPHGSVDGVWSWLETKYSTPSKLGEVILKQ